MLSNDSHRGHGSKSLLDCACSFTHPVSGIVIGYGYSQKAILFYEIEMKYYERGRKNALNITDEERELIIKLREDGYKYREIIDKTGKCRSSVSNTLRNEGLTKGGENKSEKGIKAEEFVKEYFENNGLWVEQQEYDAPFDMLVNGYEVDVKSRTSKNGNSYFFSLDPNGGSSKFRPPKDYYACVAMDTGEIWIIPSEKVKVKCIGITRGGKYDDYLFAVHQLRVKDER